MLYDSLVQDESGAQVADCHRRYADDQELHIRLALLYDSFVQDARGAVGELQRATLQRVQVADCHSITLNMCSPNKIFHLATTSADLERRYADNEELHLRLTLFHDSLVQDEGGAMGELQRATLQSVQVVVLHRHERRRV